MKGMYPQNKIDKKYIFVFGMAVLFSWVLHEFAHWATGEFLGYKMGMTLNKTFPINGKYASDLHYQLISAAGPLFTLAEAVFVFVFMQRHRKKLFYPFLFTCFYMRLFAAFISLLNPNDEARISHAIGLGTYTLPVIMTAILFILVYRISKAYRFSFKFNFASLGLTILFSSIIILTDQYLHVRLL